MSHPAPPSSPRSGPALRRAGWLALTLVLLLGIGAAARVYSKARQSDALAERTARDAVRHVLTAQPRAGEGRRQISLPGTLKGRQEAPIYARASGYLQRWTHDIGQRVSAGELLAVIDAPEAEQELLQARAAREQIHSRSLLAASSLERWEGLRQRDAVSQQELDERRAAQRQGIADLAAADANVRRLEQLKAFRRVTAPFDGVIVRRNVDVGALVSAGTGAGTRELFYLAQTDLLRIDVAVPQAYAAAVKAGQEVKVRLLERGGAPFVGTVARTSGAIDSATRSMQVEIALPNADGRLLPGAYVEVTLPLANPAKTLVVPPGVLQFRQEGARVAVVLTDAHGFQRIALRPVTIGRDLGRAVEIQSGVTVQDALVLNPHDAIEEGERVVARAAPTETKTQPLARPGNAASGPAPTVARPAASGVPAIAQP
jgi:RND family efflux transporter MFP subunit